MEILIKAIIISLFCVGLRIITGKGMILFFLRMPYEWAVDRSKILTYALKPIIGCCTCFASFWTIAIELGYYNTLTLQSVIIAFVVAALNSVIHAYYEKLTK